jgi:hypothetical protein
MNLLAVLKRDEFAHATRGGNLAISKASSNVKSDACLFGSRPSFRVALLGASVTSTEGTGRELGVRLDEPPHLRTSYPLIWGAQRHAAWRARQYAHTRSRFGGAASIMACSLQVRPGSVIQRTRIWALNPSGQRQATGCGHSRVCQSEERRSSNFGSPAVGLNSAGPCGIVAWNALYVSSVL